MSLSTNYTDRIKYHHHESRSIEHHHPKSPRSIEHHHLRTIESRWLRLLEVIDIGWWGWAGSFNIFGIWR